MRAMRNFSALIDDFGVPELATLLSVDESHVRTMKARDSVPAIYWGPMIEAASKRGIRGVTWKALKALRDSRFSARERAPA